MKYLNGKFFEVKVAVEKADDKGVIKAVKEAYVIETETFGDAEEKIIGYIEPSEVLDISIAQYKEVYLEDNEDKYYKIKAQFVVFDENTGKEKNTNVMFLVEGKDIDGAKKAFDAEMSSSTMDYSIVSITETPIMLVYEEER